MDLVDKTILLVEDEAAIALLEKRWLKNEGFNVIHVSNGTNAINMVRKDPGSIDLVLMDIDLGKGIDGTAAAREILKDNDIPLLFLSSHTEKDIVNKTEQITSYGYVVKGTDETILLASIKMAFKLHNAYRELKTKEETLKTSEEHFKSLFENAPLGYQSLDGNACFLDVNEAWLNIMGYSREEVIGRWFGDFMTSECQKAVEERFPMFKARGEVHTQFEMIKKDGSIAHVAFDGRIGYKPNGEFKRTHCILRDITENKKTEEKLLASEQRFRTLVEKAPAAIIIAKKGKTVYSNAVFARMFGFQNLDEIIEKPVIDHIAPESKEEVLEYIKRREQGECAPREYETTGLKKDGQKFPLYVQADLVQLPDGPATIGFFTDLTEHNRINQALRESEERLRFVVEGGKIGFWDWDIVSGEIHRNEQLAHMLGYNMEEIRSAINEGMDFIHPDDREKVRESILNLLNEMSTVHLMEYRMLSRAENYRWIHDRAMVTMKSPEGKPVRMSGIQVDVTERKRAELQLKQYAEELQSSNAAKDKFFSIISHDLRGPFWGLLGLIKELKKNVENMDKTEIAEIAGVMSHSAEETYELLTKLLEWSRLQTGRFRFNPVALNLFSEVEEIRKLFFPAASHKLICIYNNTDNNTFAFVDKNALSIVLRNLIDNSIKFSNAGGKIFIESKENGNFVEVSVSDTGIGMNQEVLDNIFSVDSGFTTKGTNNESGSGLGLVLCLDLIRMCGGEISVKSQEKEGTKFTFTLPLV